MNSLYTAFITECMKLRRSRIFWITVVIFCIVPLMMGLMMFVAQHPDMAAKLGMVGTKAELFGRNDWAGYVGLLIQMMASVGYIGFGFVTSWVFGREYSDRTMKDILALPISRTSIVVAKFLVVIIWCALLSIILFAVGHIIGQFLTISGWSMHVLSTSATQFFTTAFLTLFLCTPVAFFASYGRGLIAALGFVILSLVMAQFIGLVGLGPYFPWAIPGVYTAPAGTEGMQLVFSSYIILVVTIVLGFVGTIAWWRFADQK